MKKIFYSLNYVWRLFGTGISFTFFGVGALFLSLFIFPCILLFIKDELKRKIAIRRTISFSFKCFIYFMHYIGLFDFKPISTHLLKEDNGVMLVANHPTLIDVVSIIAFTPNANCIVKKDLWHNPFLKGVVKAAGYIPNENPEAILSGCKKAIEDKDILIIFPEGTRTKPGKLPEFQRGAAHIALAIGCPMRCVEMTCLPLTLSKGVPWYKIPPKRALFKLEVKDLIVPKEVIEEGTPRPLAARRLTRLLLNQYCAPVS